MNMSEVYIILEDGHVFKGKSFGAKGESLGELVFTTGMVGYVETLTDPSYAGQIIMHTFPQIGNYGIIPEDFESNKCHAKAVIVRDWCDIPSNFRNGGNLDEFLKAQNVVGVYGVDTREITQIIREEGVMNALITTEKPSAVPECLKYYKVSNVVAETSTGYIYTEKTISKTKYSVALLDFGAKSNIVRELQKRGCVVTVLPYNTKAEEILELNPDGLMLSNGAGDPSENIEIIMEIEKLFGKLPIFGICLGHQLLALAAGGKTEKLPYGHRGANQPVKEIATGKVYITSQNHGYAVILDSLDKNIAVQSYINLNDNTCEGIDYPTLNAFSLQFHPEAHSGPYDTKFAFDKFIEMMDGGDR